MGRGLSTLLLLTLTLPGAGCAVSSGAFDTVGWAPTNSFFAVADRHDLVRSQTSLVASRRPDDDMRFTLVLSAAYLAPGEEWRFYNAERLLNLKRDLAITDGLLLWDIPLDDVEEGAELSATLSGEGGTGGGDFRAALVTGAEAATAAEEGLGSDVEVKLFVDAADPMPGGFITGRVEVTRERGDGQPSGVATGEVVTTFQRVSVMAERLGKSNLAIAQPVMDCAAKRGPTRSGGCRHQEPLEFLDATSTASAP